jgi:hypothetical protein
MTKTELERAKNALKSSHWMALALRKEWSE